MQIESVDDRSKRRRTDANAESDDDESLDDEIYNLKLNRRLVERLGTLFADEGGCVDNRMKPTMIQYASNPKSTYSTQS